MKLNNKIFTLGLGSLTTISLLTSCMTTNVITNTSIVNKRISVSKDEQTAHDSCTITYMGKNCVKDGKAIIARATDNDPKAVHLKLKHYNTNELANKILIGKNGLTYQFPNHTYAYLCCPLSDKGCPVTIDGNELWENNGINEMGVGVSCTLTCHCSPTALAADPYIRSGIGEELLNNIIIPQASSARQAMEIAASLIDTYGNQDGNLIMSVDQNEAWLMEMYCGHQYCAIKLPDDKVCVAGNEYILDSLHDLGINQTNAQNNCIVSTGLLSMPVTHGFAKFIDGTPDDQKDVYHLDLFHTYARSLTDDSTTDGAHMRTWRGYSLFDKSPSSEYKTYDWSKKYPPFFTPKDENGQVRHDLSVHDVMQVYRDEYDELIEGPKAQERFVQRKNEHNLRTIAVEHTRAIHIMTSDKNLPKELAANFWYCPSSANYTPFILLNNGMTSVDGEYAYYPDRFDFDENCSAVLFRELNKLGWYDRKNYGYPIQNYWRTFENIYGTQMQQVINDASKLNLNEAKDIITNFNRHIRNVHIQAVRDVKNDLMWHIMDQEEIYQHSKFNPLVDLENYVKELGWVNYKFNGTTATFERQGNKCTYQISDGKIYSKGKLTIGNNQYQLLDSIKNNKVYVDFAILNDAIASKSEIRLINIYDYKSTNNLVHLAWIIPLTVVVAAGIGIGIYFIVRKSRKNKLVINK